MLIFKASWVLLCTAALPAIASPVRERGLPPFPPVSGQSRFTVSTPGTVLNVTPAQMWNYIGNFCDPSWQSVQLISTTSKCNQPGNTRTFSVLGLTLQERLDYNYGSYSNPDPRQTIFGQLFTLVGTYVFQGTTISNVHDLLTISKDGKNAKIGWIVTGCSTDPKFSVQVFTAQHGSSVANAEGHMYSQS